MAKPDLRKLHETALEWHKRGEFAQAEKLYQEILRHMPNLAEVHNSRGAALAALKRLKEATEAFERATGLQPGNENFRYNFANALKEQGLLPQSIDQFLQVVNIKPDHVAARIQLGLLYQQQEQWREAMEQFNFLCNLNPGMVEAFEQLGYCLLKILRYGDAEGVFMYVLKLAPSSLHGFQGLAQALMGLNRMAEAVGWIKKALLLYPNDYSLRIGLGRALVEMGSQQEAIELFAEIIESNPDKIEAYNELALVKKFRPQDEPLILQMERLLEHKQSKRNDLIAAYFSLGKVCDDIGQYDRAFHFYDAGNRLNARDERSSFSIEEFKEGVSAISTAFSAHFFATHAAMGHDSDQPVFVVGMPRSGTTLTEQILASHPLAEGAGEVNFWSSARIMLPIELATDIPYPQCANLLTKQVAVGIGDQYLATLQQLIGKGTAQRVVDKMPQNFFFLGLIAVVFPKAKIVHIQRDAMDNGLSLFFQNFQVSHPYSYDLKNIGAYYKEYEHLMQHWREVLPIKMLEIKYEELVADQERVTRQLIDYIGLPWDERCLQPEKAQKAVRTASLWQARQPVYKTSVARWKRYEKHLDPLKKALGYQDE